MTLVRSLVLIALVGCGDVVGGTDDLVSPPSPGRAPEGRDVDIITHPAPPPRHLPACTPSSVEPCALYHVVEPFDGPESSASQPLLLAVDDESVYWNTLRMDPIGNANAGELRRIPKSGVPLDKDESEVLVSAPMNYFVVDDQSIFWSERQSLNVMSKNGEDAPTVIHQANANVLHFAVDATDIFFQAPGLFRVPRAGGVAVALTESSCGLGAADASAVYCAMSDGVYRVPKDGTPSTLLNPAHGQQMVLFGSELYVEVERERNKLLVLPTEGGPPVHYAAELSPSPARITGYDGALYIVQSNDRLARIPTDKSPPSTRTVPFLTGPRDMVVDATGVYWMDYLTTCLEEEEQRCRKGVAETVIFHLPAVF